MTGRYVYLGEPHSEALDPVRMAAYRYSGFDVLPLTDPPKIKCVGWISGKGV